jgi:hypothetical protein
MQHQRTQLACIRQIFKKTIGLSSLHSERLLQIHASLIMACAIRQVSKIQLVAAPAYALMVAPASSATKLWMVCFIHQKYAIVTYLGRSHDNLR